MANDNSQRQVLDVGQLKRIGPIFCALLLPGAEWIHRRRESVQIVDETALKRQISVDFTLPDKLGDGRAVERVGDHGCLAPIFLLPKAPKKLMSFDMVDASGKSLPLMTSAENRDVSAATLVSMAESTLKNQDSSGNPVTLSDGLQRSLEEVATNDAQTGEILADHLFDAARLNALTPDLELLLEDERFCFWLSTLAHSSIIPVWCLDGPKREIVKLSFREPVRHELPLASKLGWSPYRLWVGSSYVEAQNHHFEAAAPHGMRITKARLATDSGQDDGGGFQDGFLRRLHLYVPNSEQAGGALAKLDLRVSARGFLRDAWIPALLVTAALAWAWIRAQAIVTNPNSSPSLFLLLPGLIATYLSRPDRHALTSRLLSGARIVLMGCGVAAFIAAGAVAFLGAASADPCVIDDRTTHLRILIGILFALSVLGLAVLLLAWARASDRRWTVRGWLWAMLNRGANQIRAVGSGYFSFRFETETSPEETYKAAQAATDSVVRNDETDVEKDRAPYEYQLLRGSGGLTALHLTVRITRVFRGSTITIEGWGPSHGERRFGWRLGVWWTGRRLRHKLRASFKAMR